MSKTIIDEAKELNTNKLNFNRVNATRPLLIQLELSEKSVQHYKRLLKKIESGDYSYLDSPFKELDRP
jgi:hypothetical protein